MIISTMQQQVNPLEWGGAGRPRPPTGGYTPPTVGETRVTREVTARQPQSPQFFRGFSIHRALMLNNNYFPQCTQQFLQAKARYCNPQV